MRIHAVYKKYACAMAQSCVQQYYLMDTTAQRKFTFQSSDGSLINTSIVHMRRSELLRKALSAWIMMPSISPFSFSGIIKLRICRVIRNGINSGKGKN